MKKFTAFIITASMLFLSGCDKGPNEIDLRSQKFAQENFSEETVRKAIDGFFYVDSFKINSVDATESGVATIDVDAGMVKEKRVLLLRAAATAYSFTRILMLSEKTQKVVVSFNGSVQEENGTLKPYHVITTAMSREQAVNLDWGSMEDTIARDRDYNGPLSLFEVTHFDKSFEEFIQSTFYAKLNNIMAPVK